MDRKLSGTLLSGDAIARKMDEYFLETGEYPHYIVVSSSTLAMIKALASSLVACEATRTYGEYRGVPLAVCDKLGVGQFEIV